MNLAEPFGSAVSLAGAKDTKHGAMSVKSGQFIIIYQKISDMHYNKSITRYKYDKLRR